MQIDILFISNELDISIVTCNLSISFQMNLIFPFDIFVLHGMPYFEPLRFFQVQIDILFISNELDISIVTCNLSISFQMNLIFPFDIFVLHGMPYLTG